MPSAAVSTSTRRSTQVAETAARTWRKEAMPGRGVGG